MKTITLILEDSTFEMLEERAKTFGGTVDKYLYYLLLLSEREINPHQFLHSDKLEGRADETIPTIN
jgi:hypothetical protein